MHGRKDQKHKNETGNAVSGELTSSQDATEACSTDTGIHFARFTVTAEESRAFDLVSQRDFNLRFPLVKFDYAGDADDLPLEHGDPLVSLHFRPNCNEPGERLIGVSRPKLIHAVPSGLTVTETTRPRTSTLLPTY